MQFGPDLIGPGAEQSAAQVIQEQKLNHHQPKRPHPGGLETLPEASHANALSMASGPSPPSLQAYQNEDSHGNSLDAILSSALAALSPPSRSRALTRTKGYAGIAIDLANERWRERWSRLCLAPVDQPDKSTPNPQVFHAGDPGGMGGSWELLAQASGAGGLGVPLEGSLGSKMTRSSSRKVLPQAEPSAGSGSTNTNTNTKTTPAETAPHIEAEQWRQAPCFHPGEVNVSRFEDSDGVTAIASSWLELDSPDEGIRLDSELVSA